MTCPYCNNTFKINDELTGEIINPPRLEMDSNFNGLYFFKCPNCDKEFSKFPWEVYEEFSD